MTASTTPAAVRFQVELDTVVDDELVRDAMRGYAGTAINADALTDGQLALLGASLLAAQFPGLDGVRVADASGPGGGHPVIVYTGTADALMTFLREAFELDLDEDDIELQPVSGVMPA